MATLEILRWDKDRAWTDWGGHLKKDLAGRLKSACPSMRQTERKRLAQQIVAGNPVSVLIEVPKFEESLCHILEATGAIIRMTEERPPNQPVQTTAMTPPPSTTRGAPLSDF